MVAWCSPAVPHTARIPTAQVVRVRLGYGVGMVRGLVDIGAESVLLAGAGRAILLQIANPAVGLGVAEHSNFAERPLDRLRGTLTYVYGVVYGTDEQRRKVRRIVNRAHAPVHREATAGTRGYSAFDAQAQLWVVATLYETAVMVYQKVYGTLDDESADRVYLEYEKIGTALQLPSGMWPRDRPAFQAYWDRSVGALEVVPEVQLVARDLLYLNSGPVWLRMSMPVARFVTAGLLPAQLRQSFGLPWSARRQRRFTRLMGFTAWLYPRLPLGLRHGVKNWCLRTLDATAD